MVNPLPTPPAAQAPVAPSMPHLEHAHAPSTTSTRSYHHHRELPTPHTTASSPPVVRYSTSDRTSRGSRTSQATTATTPSLSSSRTHGSASDTPIPPEGMERTPWATAPSRTSRPGSNRYRSASVDRVQVSSEDGWSDSLARLRLGQPHQQPQQQQPEYRVEIISNTRTAPPPTNEATRPSVNKLQRQVTMPASAPPAVVSYIYYDREPPLISHSSRLSDLKEDYRNPGSERSDIIRRKINYLRFELGYTGLRRSRGDGNCFYR
ncbi:hypothetical protein FRC08_018048, partial [Ceratobasidium sp. 394]